MSIELAAITWWLDNAGLALGSLAILAFAFAWPRVARRLYERRRLAMAARRERKRATSGENAMELRALLAELQAVADDIERKNLRVTPAPGMCEAPNDVDIAEARTTPPSTPSSRHATIYRLADRGQAPLQIAEALRVPLGEVELIINLRELSRAAA